MKLPIYELEIEESPDSEFEVDFVAMVDKPAIKANWQAFADVVHFATDEDERVIIGPALIPDMLIFRKDERGEYYVKFSKDQIQKIAQKFFEKGYQKNVNLMHSDSMIVQGATIFQSFIKDSAKGIEGMKDELPDGTWYLGAKINNEQAWQLVKQEKLRGWSIEGMFKYKRQEMSAAELFSQIESLLKDF